MEHSSDYDFESRPNLHGDDVVEASIEEVNQNLVEGDLNDQIVDHEFDLNLPPPSPQQSNELSEPITQNQPNHHKQRITNQMRQQILLHLLNISVNGVLPHGSIKKQP